MAKLLRKVQYKTNWDPKGEFSNYLPSGQSPADALQDLRTKGNALSLWQVEDNGSNLDRVLAAIVSISDHLQTINYLMVDEQHVTSLNLKLVQSKGETHDAHANENWHFDLTQLSASDLANLANTMLSHGQTDRRNDKSLASLLKGSVEKGYIDHSKLGDKVQARIPT